MKNLIVIFIAAFIAQKSFAFDTTYKTTVSLAVEVVFSTAIISGTSEISLYSISDAQKVEALKIQSEVQDYFQSGHINLFIGEKISSIKEINSKLSDDESIDILLAASEVILSK